MSAFRKFAALIVFSMGGLMCTFGARAQELSSPQTIWRLLDYIAVDYSAAVEDGQVISELEYAEMQEFANSVVARLENLPPTAEQVDLLREAEGLNTAIAQKASPTDVAERARGLADAVLAAYPVPLAPSMPPDLARGEALYAQQCASCHGERGHGDGVDAQGLEPPPIDFTDRGRAQQRSVFGLYQVIDQGIEGTSMASYDALSPEDRWALAFYVGSLAFSEEEAQNGQRIWTSDQQIRNLLPDLESLTRITPSALAQRLDEGNAFAITSYLRRHPEAVESSEEGSLALARARLLASRDAYQDGDRQQATDLALSAYLDGFEPVELVLSVRDNALMLRIEAAMIELRNLVGSGAPTATVETQVQEILTLLDEAETILAEDEVEGSTSFIGAFTILLREGLEALLIIVAMVAFLHKAERPEVLRYVHAGWLTALAAGVLTWLAANNLIFISGAGRELTEGIGALLAAIVLVTVGIWMHSKSHAGAWQTYIKEKMSHALSRESAWFLFLLAFVVVYREVFETILFFIALWNRGQELAILAGAAAAVAALALCAWGLLSYSRRLPIAQFFQFSSLLIAALAVVLTGKGIAALQEAGWFKIDPIAALPRVEIFGFYPTWEGMIGQGVVLGVLLAAYWFNNEQHSRPA